MSPELLAAVADRIEHGYSDEKIREELIAAGHDDVVVTEVLATARAMSSSNVRQIPAAELPTIKRLVADGWRFAKQHPVLSLIMAVPVFMLYGLETMQGLLVDNTLVLAGLTLSAVVANILCTIAVLYIVVKAGDGEPQTVSTGFSWAVKHVWELLWLGILAFLVVWGSFVPFFIPGLIVAFYMYFAQYVYISEGVKGFSALLRSRQLVLGNGLAVAGRLVGVGVLFVGLFIVAFIGLGLIIGVGSVVSGVDMSELPAVDWTIGLLGQLAGAVLTVVGFRVIATIYQALALKKPYDPTGELPGRKKYRALAVWGLVSLVLLVAVVAGFAPEGDFANSDFNREPASERIIDLDAKDRAMELRLNQ